MLLPTRLHYHFISSFYGFLNVKYACSAAVIHTIHFCSSYIPLHSCVISLFKSNTHSIRIIHVSSFLKSSMKRKHYEKYNKGVGLPTKLCMHEVIAPGCRVTVRLFRISPQLCSSTTSCTLGPHRS